MAGQLRHLLLSGVLLTATATVAATAIGDPAVALAVPSEWDIGAYDQCIKKVDDLFARGVIGDATSAYRECCEKTGGIWNLAATKCEAPPANPAGAQPGNVPTHTLAPASPPVVRSPGSNAPTFTLEPVG